MKLQVRYDIHNSCKIILQEQLNKLQLPYTLTGLGEIEINETLTPEKYEELETNLAKYAIEIIDDPKNVFTQKVKDAIVEMVYIRYIFRSNLYVNSKLYYSSKN